MSLLSGASPAGASFGPTGDAENSFKKLARLLMRVHYPTMFARERVMEGDTATLIPMLRYALSGLSHRLARRLLNQGYAIYAQTDAAFVEAAYRVCMHAFHYYPVLSMMQFMHPPKGYAERKMAMVAAVLQCALSKHAELTREAKAEGADANSGVRSSSAKKKIREAVQVRLTAAKVRSDEMVRQEGDSDAEGASSAASSRRRSLSAQRSAPSSARTRSASASRGSSSMSSSRKVKPKSSPYAVRPKTAGGSARGGPIDLQASSSSAAAASYHTAFGPAAIHDAHNNAQHDDDMSIDAMAPHSVARSIRNNGDVMDLHEAHDSLRDSTAQRPKASPVKKAWVHEHNSGSVQVSVVGYVEQPEGSPAPKAAESSLSRSRQAEYSRAQDVARLKRREAEQEEADRIRLLQLQHQEYAVQNSPHVEAHDDAQSSHSYAQQRQQLTNGSFDEEDAEGQQAPRPFGVTAAFEQQLQSPSRGVAQYQQLSRNVGGAGSVGLALLSPSAHLVGDEHHLNASFIRVQGAQSSEAPATLDAINEQLHTIADRNHAVANRVAQGSARKPTLHQHQQQQQHAVDTSHALPSASSSRPAVSASPSAPAVSSLLAAAAPALSTPLETRLFSMLESIQAKMARMESNMQHMEQKMVRAGIAHDEEYQQEERKQAPVARSVQPTYAEGDLSYSRSSHPPPAVPASHVSASRFAQSTGPSSTPLVPHPAHVYTPASSYFGPPRGVNVNALSQHGHSQWDVQNHAPPPAASSGHAGGSHPSTTAASFAQAYPHLSSSFTSSSSSSAAPAGALVSSRPGFAPSSPSTSRSHASHARGPAPVHMLTHVPHAAITLSPARGGAAGGLLADSAVSSRVTAAHPLGSFAHSAFAPAHPSSGSASMSRDSVLPSTDSFIEQLKQRLKHTEDLIHTARNTAKETREYNPYQ